MSFLEHQDGLNGGGGGLRGSVQEELMVFGYSCKLYRDDAKAMAEDSGVYLIPWMGDHSLMIDRYDCRGHLYDKGQFGLKSNLPRRWKAEEEAFEEMLDHERYMALDKDLREEGFRKEEEEKRLYEAMQDGYTAVGFKYAEVKANAASEPEVPRLQPPPPPPLSSVIVDRPDDEDTYVLPEGLNLPNGIDTPTTNKLHNIIEKTALFISQQGTQMEIRIKINQKNNPYFAFMDFNDRLHPYYKHILRAISSGNYTPKPPVEQKVEIMEKKDGEHQLEQRNDNVEEQEDSEDEDSDGDYELHPLLMGSHTSNSAGAKNATTNSSTSHPSSANDHSGAVSAAQPYMDMDHYQQQSAYAYYMDQSALYNSGLGNVMPSIPMNALIEDPPHPPPPDIQPIIDKLAEYVAKHGHAFEDTVKRNGDPRLQFINSSHEYYKYFMLRKNLYRQKFMMEELANENKPKQIVTQDLPSVAKETTDVQTLKEDGSVGFKIATKEEKVMSGVYLGSASDEEEGEEDLDKEDVDKEDVDKEDESHEATTTDNRVGSKDSDDTDSTAKKTTTVVTTTLLPKSSVVEEQEKTKSERRKKAAMFVEQLRQKRAEKIAIETDIIGPLLPHEYKYCNRKYVEPSPPPVTERLSGGVNDFDEDEDKDEDGSSAKRMKMTGDDEDDDYLLEVEEPAAPSRMRTRLTVKSIPRH